MKLGNVIGKVWATIKDESLSGKRILLVQPLNQECQPCGEIVIAVDSVGTSVGDTVYWVTGAEGSMPFLPEETITSEATIVGLVDTVTHINC